MALAGEASAQYPGAGADAAVDAALARSLLEEGRQLAAEGRLRAAVEKLDKSAGFERRPETLLLLGDCHERMGATASAYGDYRRAAERARTVGDADRASEAEKRALALEAKLSRVKVVVTALVPGLVVTLDHTRPLDPSAWGMPLPLDPGQHWVEAKAPDKAPYASAIEVPAEPGVVTVTLPALGPRPPAEPPPAQPIPFTPAPSPYANAGLIGGVLAALTLVPTYSVGCGLLADANGSAQQRQIGGAMAGGALGVGAVALGAILGTQYRPDARQGFGTTMIFLGGAAGWGALTIVALWGAGFHPSDQALTATAIAGLGVAPVLITGGILVARGAPWHAAPGAGPPPVSLVPLFAPGRAGLSLQGAF